jgi:hypothetical protein
MTMLSDVEDIECELPALDCDPWKRRFSTERDYPCEELPEECDDYDDFSFQVEAGDPVYRRRDRPIY